MGRAHKMLTWCRVEAAALAILLAANEQGSPCGHRFALAAHHRPQLHTHHKVLQSTLTAAASLPQQKCGRCTARALPVCLPSHQHYRLCGWCCTGYLMEKELPGAC